jgi:hypothetical protein
MLVFYKRETKGKNRGNWDNRGVKKNGKNNNKPDPRADIKGIIPRLTIQAARFN